MRDLAQRTWRWIRDRRMPVEYLLATVAVLWALWPIPFDLPISQDHAHHYLATRILVDDLFASGHWTGWTHRVGTGLPYGDTYGSLVYVVTGLLRILSFGLVPLRFSYSFGIVLVWLVPALAIVAWARRLGAGRLGAAFAALAFVLDPGGGREGGWVYSMFHAVWPQLFATGVWLWAMIAMLRLAERPTFRRLAVAALVAGLSVWAHPMNALNLAVSLPLMVLFVAAVRDRASPVPVTPWICAAAALAAVVGMGWFSHLLAAGDSLASFTAYGPPISDFAAALLGGEPFLNQLPIVSMAALAGVVAALAAARTEGLLSLALVAVFVVLSSMCLIALFDVGLSSANRLVMYRRFLVTAKPLWYALAGLGVSTVWAGVQSLRSRRGAETSWPLVAAAGAFFAWCTIAGLGSQVVGPAARPLTARIAGLDDDLAQLTSVLKGLETSRQARVGYYHSRGQHGDYALFAVADAGLGYVNSRRVPCHALKWDNRTTSPAAMARLGATHIITRGEQKLPATRLVASAGIFRVYEITAPVTSPVTMEGGGEAVVESWDAMRVRVRISGATERSRLIVGFAPYRKWHARQGETQLKIEAVRRDGMTFSAIDGVKDGVLELTFVDTAAEDGAFGAMILTLALLGFCLWRGDDELPAIGARWGGTRFSNVVVIAALGVTAAGLGGLRIMGGRALDRAWGAPVVEVLHRDVASFAYDPNPYCVRPFSRDPRAGCNERTLEPTLIVGPRDGRRMPGCVRFGVPDRGSSVVAFDLPADATKVRGRIHWLEHKPSSATLTMSAREEKIGPGRPFVVPVDGARSVSVRVENGGSTTHVCLELVATSE